MRRLVCFCCSLDVLSCKVGVFHTFKIVDDERTYNPTPSDGHLEFWRFRWVQLSAYDVFRTFPLFCSILLPFSNGGLLLLQEHFHGHAMG